MATQEQRGCLLACSVEAYTEGVEHDTGAMSIYMSNRYLLHSIGNTLPIPFLPHHPYPLPTHQLEPVDKAIPID
jgi:hypothetical protein